MICEQYKAINVIIHDSSIRRESNLTQEHCSFVVSVDWFLPPPRHSLRIDSSSLTQELPCHRLTEWPPLLKTLPERDLWQLTHLSDLSKQKTDMIKKDEYINNPFWRTPSKCDLWLLTFATFDQSNMTKIKKTKK